MTTVSKVDRARGFLAVIALVGGLASAERAAAISLDDRGEMRLGMRAYTAVRVGTEQIGGNTDPLNFPDSAAGHVRQHRYFLELKLDHDIKRLAKTSWSFPFLLGWMNPNELKYTLVYRGEGEGVFDYGSSEYSDQKDKLSRVRLPVPNIPNLGSRNTLTKAFIDQRIRRLERIGRIRNRLLQAYLDYDKGPVFVRVGRQVLAWGETDIFRLLDNINPLDDSFGGFFISLDERRLPVDMLRSSLQVGSLGPLSDSFLEGFVALGNTVATQPGIPNGSPWSPGGLAFPNPSLHQANDVPDKLKVRGGARAVANLGDATFSLAHYYTYLDVPGVQFRLPVGLPSETNQILAVQRYPRVQISGGSVTFPVPSWYTIVRSEAAYFKGEPMNRQGTGNSRDAICPGGFLSNGCPAGAAGTAAYHRLLAANNTEGGLDPFVYPRFLDTTRKHPFWGGVLQRDTLNTSVGFDINRLIRWLNPGQTTLISTQFFYKHVFDSPGDLVLPVPYRNIALDKQIPIVGSKFAGLGACGGNGNQACKLRPRLYHLADNRFLQTLLITTSYSAGRIVPQFGLFYDWQGAIVFQPGVTFVRDPFRVVFDYTRIDGAPTGQFGAVRDKDNVRFQFEYVF
jgi:hypothetical protein